MEFKFNFTPASVNACLYFVNCINEKQLSDEQIDGNINARRGQWNERDEEADDKCNAINSGSQYYVIK